MKQGLLFVFLTIFGSQNALAGILPYQEKIHRTIQQDLPQATIGLIVQDASNSLKMSE